MPVPRIPTVGRSLAALPAAAGLPPKMRRALFTGAGRGLGEGREGGVEGGLRQAAGFLHQPLPQAPQGRHLRASAQGPVGTSPSEEQRTTARAEPAPPARRKTLTSVALAGACRVRGPASDLLPSLALRRKPPPPALLILVLRLRPQLEKPRPCPLGGHSLRGEAGSPTGDRA